MKLTPEYRAKHHIGPSDVCMDCRDELAEFTTGWQLCEACRRARVERQEACLAKDPNDPTDDEQFHSLAIGVLVNEDLWTLPEYLAWLTRDGGGLTTDLEHWADYDITKASQLGDYLDGCVAREMEKVAY